MRDTLPRKPNKNETIIINLDRYENPGTHWVALLKIGKNCLYFDPIGNLHPPRKLITYLRGCKIYYNIDRYQKLGSKNCGALCVRFLYGEFF